MPNPIRYTAFLISTLCLLSSCLPTYSEACSVLYYVDTATGKIYVVNNEDFWYDVDAYIQIESSTSETHARLWYGWNNFAQGGVNDAGLFFDAAVTPDMPKVKGKRFPKGNFGDDLLANCSTVDEALAYLDKRKVALTQSHFILGDSTGKAVIVEWVEGKQSLHWIKNNRLIMTNFLLSKPEAGNYPCPRFESIQKRVLELEKSQKPITLNSIGNTIGQAVQIPQPNEKGRLGGTLYTSFINLTDKTFVLSFQLSNERILKLDLQTEFDKGISRKIALKDL